ncbi:hypothetical protein [Roseobacter sinensis]|uniref:Uncharacterized protein n=1 Tax=Roseobacter sinensis TaxID=2931391 RepID=A0ABT3BIC6_9RHOB|nr:hypothetical protein [Roseobacter sp. WL0113]MCV3273322.1 hypothetical protein [Roseobacter sp. WL0113]
MMPLITQRRALTMSKASSMAIVSGPSQVLVRCDAADKSLAARGMG